MVRLRLARLGAKKNPFYRVVASDSRSPRNGRFIEKLGFYDPKSNPIVVTLDLSRVDYWLSVGAQPSDTVANLISRARKANAADSAKA
ncbi:MAG: ribosomal protein [Pseudomonadota bacterium]